MSYQNKSIKIKVEKSAIESHYICYQSEFPGITCVKMHLLQMMQNRNLIVQSRRPFLSKF